MHHLLAVLSLATALVAPPRRRTTRLRAASLERKGDDYIFEDIAKNLGKGDQDRLYQYQLELAERYGEDKIGRAAPPPKPKKPKQDPKKKVLFEWSDADMANSKARVDATKAARACRRPYATIAALQLRHAPKSLSPNAAFYEHASPSAVDAVKARRSGVTLGAKQPLKKRPLFGGMADVSNAPAAPATIVGVDERLSAGAKNSIFV